MTNFSAWGPSCAELSTHRQGSCQQGLGTSSPPLMDSSAPLAWHAAGALTDNHHHHGMLEGKIQCKHGVTTSGQQASQGTQTGMWQWATFPAPAVVSFLNSDPTDLHSTGHTTDGQEFLQGFTWRMQPWLPALTSPRWSQRCPADNISLTALRGHIRSGSIKAGNQPAHQHRPVRHRMRSQHRSWITRFKSYKSCSTIVALLPWPSSWAHWDLSRSCRPEVPKPPQNSRAFLDSHNSLMCRHGPATSNHAVIHIHWPADLTAEPPWFYICFAASLTEECSQQQDSPLNMDRVWITIRSMVIHWWNGMWWMEEDWSRDLVGRSLCSGKKFM